MTAEIMPQSRPSGRWDKWALGLFWSWNIIFLAFMLLGFAPNILPELIQAIRDGTIPIVFVIYGLVLTAVPLASMILGLTILRKSPRRLFALGYAVEGPLMLMLGIRFFIIREANPAVSVLLVVAGLGMAAFLWHLLDRSSVPGDKTPGRLQTILRLTGLTLFLAVALYAAVWVAFYTLPVLAYLGMALTELVKNLSQVLRDLFREPRYLLVSVLGFILMVYTATLFVLLPVAAPLLAVRAWLEALHRAHPGRERTLAGGIATTALVAFAALFVLANRQPQRLAFDLLGEPPTTREQAQRILQQKDAIRTGLLNAYLAPLRYISSVGEVDHVKDMYMDPLKFTPEAAAQMQSLYEVVARPMLYEPVKDYSPPPGQRRNNLALREEPQEAARLYQRFFDQTIVEGERESIVRAVRSTWSAEQALTGWQAVDDREILLLNQEVTVSEQGDWAEVELYEVYQNQTAIRQEVIYYFSLPESAVVTGLWLGNSPDRDKRFVYRVSPRGAAQSLYRSEVRINVDPALLEQIGPRQYRLRAFPVEPQIWNYDPVSRESVKQDGQPLYLWLAYRVLASENAWPLPRLAEKRNVYWDASTQRLLNGNPMQVSQEDWLPLTAPAIAPVQPTSHRVDFPEGESVIVTPASLADLPQLPAGLRLALVLDRSRSMDAQAALVETSLQHLSETMEAGQVDVYLTASAYRGEDPSVVPLNEMAPDELLYFGGQNAAELLAQFGELRQGREYDAVLVLTDESGYEMGQSGLEIAQPEAPIWMVHLNGFPLGYDDDTLEIIQASGGGVTGSMEEAIARLAFGLQAGDGPTADVVDGYTWVTLPPGAAAGEQIIPVVASKDDLFAPFAARRVILAAMQRNAGALDRLENLDHLHAIAVENSVVTPYSSMIVLVLPRQEKALDELEQKGDRFEREHEDVGDTTPESFMITGVPEPEEWLLIFLAVGFLAWYAYRTRLAPQRIKA